MTAVTGRSAAPSRLKSAAIYFETVRSAIVTRPLVTSIPISQAEIAEERSLSPPLLRECGGMPGVEFHGRSIPHGGVRLENDHRSASHTSSIGPTISPAIVTGSAAYGRSSETLIGTRRATARPCLLIVILVPVSRKPTHDLQATRLTCGGGNRFARHGHKSDHSYNGLR